MTTYETFLYAARLASKMGSYSVACELYETALSWKDGDLLLDLKSKHGNLVIETLIETLREKVTYTTQKRKIQAIKDTIKLTNLGLKEAKELVEVLASRMNLSFD